MPILGSLAGASVKGFGFGGGSADLVYIDEGAMIPLTSVLVNSTVSSVDIFNIPSTYKNLVIRANVICSAETSINMRFNTDSAGNYLFQQIYANTSVVTQDSGSAASGGFVGYSIGGSSLPAGFTGYIGNYASTSQWKSWVSHCSALNDSTNAYSLFTTGAWKNSSDAINKITFVGSANFLANSTFHVYGLKAA